MEDLHIHQLPNGIIIAHREDYHTKIAHAALTLGIGSRDEEPHEYGIAHFWEHMVFKGTQKRKAFHILNRLDAHGGELNAYTTKENISIYSSILSQYFDQAVELLSDITFNSIYPEKHLEKERNVILEEMAMYRDSPEDAIQDEFEALIFEPHPLGANILGTEDTIRSFQRAHFDDFIRKNLSTDQIVFSSVGPISFQKVLKICQKHLEDIPRRIFKKHVKPFQSYKPDRRAVDKPVSQSQVGVGSTAYSLHHENRIPFFMLVNVLGGPGMNSRLNLSIREKFGFVYAIDAHYTPYSDTGLFSIYFGTDKKYTRKTIQLVFREMKKLQQPLGAVQLHRAKDQLKGQLAMAEDSNLGYALMVGKSMLNFGRVFTLEEVFREIDMISSSDLADVAVAAFSPDQMSTLTFNPAL